MKGFKKLLNKDLMVLQTPTVKLTIFGLAIPLFFESIGAQIIAMIQTMLSSNFMDGFFVSPMSIALSASAPITSLSQLVTMGLSVVLSINLGRDKEKDSAKIISSAMYANVLFTIFLNSIVAVLAEPLISFMGYSGPEYIEQFPYAVDYLQKQSIVMIVLRITTGFMVILRCYGYTKIGMYATLISSSALAIFTAFMLYVISPAKENVVNGFIICRLLVRIGELIIVYFIIKKKNIPISFKVSKKWFKEIFRIGLPASVANIAYTISSVLTTKICVSLGPDPYLARIYINQIVMFVYTFGLCVAQAGAIMTGRLCGMGDLNKADKMQRQNLKLVVFANFVLSTLCIPIGNLVIKYVYSASASVVMHALPIFFIDVIVEIGRGMNHVGQQGLNATKDVKFTTAISILVGFTCSVGFAYLFGIVLNMGLSGIWTAFAMDEIIRAVIYYFRWCKGRWKKRFKKEEEKFIASQNGSLSPAV